MLTAIYGPDGHDPTVSDVPFRWQSQRGLESLRIGYVPAAFAPEAAAQGDDDAARENNINVLATLRALGAHLQPVSLPPDDLEALSVVYLAEAAAAFDEMIRA